MDVRAAEVLFKDSLAGTLVETASGGTRFTYAVDWKQPIACCLPVERREHEWAQGLHPFFQHLGPEGWLRQRQARVAHIAEEDDFGLLLRYGADCIGAVGVRSAVPLPNIEPIAEAPANPGRTISGVQRKLLVVKDGDTFRSADPTGLAPYIAKFNPEDIPTLVRNETLSLRWISAVLGKSEVTAFDLGQVADVNEHALIVTRFDRTADGKKLRLEDFAQILCKPRGQDYTGKYGAGHEDVAEEQPDDTDRGEEDDQHQDHIIVLPLDDVNQESAHTGDGIEGFGVDGTGDRHEERSRDQVDDRHHSVAEDVAEPDRRIRHALGASELDIVLIGLVDHIAPQPHRVAGDGREREGYGRQDQRPPVVLVIEHADVQDGGSV